MMSKYVISDVMYHKTEDGKPQFLTGYWDGDDLTSDVEKAQLYDTEEEYREVLSKGDFYDPAVYEVSISESGKRQRGKFFDMVHEFGEAGGD